jgi:hypothetical protein
MNPASSGAESAQKSRCVGKNALDLGIVTSLTVVRSHDR